MFAPGKKPPIPALKVCDKVVGSGRYAWVQTGIAQAEECKGVKGCTIEDTYTCNKSCDKIHAGSKCAKHSVTGNIDYGVAYTTTFSECKEIMETKKVPCSEL